MFAHFSKKKAARFNGDEGSKRTYGKLNLQLGNLDKEKAISFALASLNKSRHNARSHVPRVDEFHAKQLLFLSDLMTFF